MTGSGAPETSGRRAIDLRELTGLTTSAGRRWVVPVFAVVFGVILLDDRQFAVVWWQSLLALGILTAAAAVLVYVDGDPLPAGATFAVTVAGPLSMAVYVADLPDVDADWIGLWPMHAATLVYCHACIRGRVLAAWCGRLAMSGVVWVNATRFGGPAVDAGVVVGSLIPLAVLTFLSVTIRPAAKAVFVLRERAHDEVTRKAATRAVLAERDAQLRQLDELAQPLLRRIVSGDALTEDERIACRLLEAHLRDTLRARALLDVDVVEAVRAARTAGAEVVLIDDSGDGTSDAGLMDGDSPAEGWVALRAALLPHLRAASGGTVTVRVLPPGRRAAMTVLVAAPDGAGDPVRHEYDADGVPVAAQIAR